MPAGYYTFQAVCVFHSIGGMSDDREAGTRKNRMRYHPVLMNQGVVPQIGLN